MSVTGRHRAGTGISVRGGAVTQINPEPELSGRDRAISDLATIKVSITFAAEFERHNVFYSYFLENHRKLKVHRFYKLFYAH